MSGLAFLIFTAVVFCGVNAIPIVLKESTPNGESVIAISSTNPDVEKYLLDYASKHAKQVKTEPSENRAQARGTVVQSFSVATPGRTIAGTGRSFGDDSYTNPFYTPFFITPDFEGYDIRNWFRNIDRYYDPSFNGNGASVSATAVNDNGQVYGKIETVNLNNKGHK